MKPLTDILREYRRGELVDRATDELNEIVRAVASTGRSGKLVLTLHVKSNRGEGDQILLEAETKVTVPKAPLPTAIFFVDEDGGLHQRDPRQREMVLESTSKKDVA